MEGRISRSVEACNVELLATSISNADNDTTIMAVAILLPARNNPIELFPIQSLGIAAK
jgi:hypothetical protein